MVGAWVIVGCHERDDGRDGEPDSQVHRVTVAGVTITHAGHIPGIFG